MAADSTEQRAQNDMDAGQGQGSVPGSILDALQRLVDLEHVRDVLCPINTKFVVPDAADENRMTVSTAADTCVSVTQRRAGVRQRTRALLSPCWSR